jgi:hypothetical protein
MKSGVGDACGLFVGADFLHTQDVDAVFLGTQRKVRIHRPRGQWWRPTADALALATARAASWRATWPASLIISMANP